MLKECIQTISFLQFLNNPLNYHFHHRARKWTHIGNYFLVNTKWNISETIHPRSKWLSIYLFPSLSNVFYKPIFQGICYPTRRKSRRRKEVNGGQRVLLDAQNVLNIFRFVKRGMASTSCVYFYSTALPLLQELLRRVLLVPCLGVLLIYRRTFTKGWLASLPPTDECAEFRNLSFSHSSVQ